MNLCVTLLSSVTGSWLGRVRGRPTLYAAVRSEAQATRVVLALSLWDLTEGQPTRPLVLHLFLLRLQVAGFSLHASPGSCRSLWRGAERSQPP